MLNGAEVHAAQEWQSSRKLLNIRRFVGGRGGSIAGPAQPHTRSDGLAYFGSMPRSSLVAAMNEPTQPSAIPPSSSAALPSSPSPRSSKLLP